MTIRWTGATRRSSAYATASATLTRPTRPISRALGSHNSTSIFLSLSLSLFSFLSLFLSFFLSLIYSSQREEEEEEKEEEEEEKKEEEEEEEKEEEGECLYRFHINISSDCFFFFLNV